MTTMVTNRANTAMIGIKTEKNRKKWWHEIWIDNVIVAYTLLFFVIF